MAVLCTKVELVRVKELKIFFASLCATWFFFTVVRFVWLRWRSSRYGRAGHPSVRTNQGYDLPNYDEVIIFEMVGPDETDLSVKFLELLWVLLRQSPVFHESGFRKVVDRVLSM